MHEHQLVEWELGRALTDCHRQLEARKELYAAISGADPPLFGPYDDSTLYACFSALLACAISERPRIDRDRLLTLLRGGDLEAVQCLFEAAGSSAATRAGRPPCDNAYQRRLARFKRAARASKTCVTVDSIPDLLEHPSGPTACAIHWLGTPHPPLQRLLSDIENNVGAFIDEQPDLVGRNSLVRRGIVKYITLPDGFGLISKRNDPSKGAKFVNDLNMALAIREKLGREEGHRNLRSFRSDEAEIAISVISPLALLADGNAVFYALSRYCPYPTLEDVLAVETDPLARKTLLRCCRFALDRLFDAGVIWGDMAPRNILVNRSSKPINFVLLDFEKTHVMETAADGSARTAHARGPVFAEEFSSVCSVSELVAAFGDYFDPDVWDTTEPAPVPLARPKREIVDLLTGRGETKISFGLYNAVEREVLGARFMYVGNDGRVRRPVYLNYRVDHYLGADHDRKTTEILIAGRRHNLLDVVYDFMETLLQSYEAHLLLAGFCAGARLNTLLIGSETLALSLLGSSIDRLFACRDNAEGFRAALARFNLTADLLRVRVATSAGQLAPSALRQTARSLRDRLLRSAATALEQGDAPGQAAVIAAGFGRGEICVTSDLDIAVFGSAAAPGDDSTKQALIRVFAQLCDNELEFLPDVRLDGLPALIESSPGYLLDYASIARLAGPAEIVPQLQSQLGALLQRRPDLARTALACSLSAPASAQSLLPAVNLVLWTGWLADHQLYESSQSLLYLLKFEHSFAARGFVAVRPCSTAATDAVLNRVHAALGRLGSRMPAVPIRERPPHVSDGGGPVLRFTADGTDKQRGKSGSPA